MSLATLDKSPPPFFRQGPTALTKLVFFSVLALFLMVADTRFQFIVPLRSGLNTLIWPMQQAMAGALRLWEGGGDYVTGLTAALAARDGARERAARLSERAMRTDELAKENAHLRALLELRPALSVKSLAAEVMYEARDPYSRKLFIDRGTTHGVVLGAPVIQEQGVVGQVTRAYLFTSEVTLLTDPHAAIPVLNARTQQRSAAFGAAGGVLELRFMAANADVQPGDLLSTSGVDGIYPPGLPVAKVVQVERRGEAGFARINLQVAASADGLRHVLVLEPTGLQLPKREEPAAQEPARKQKKPSGNRPGAASAGTTAAAAPAAGPAGSAPYTAGAAR